MLSSLDSHVYVTLLPLVNNSRGNNSPMCNIAYCIGTSDIAQIQSTIEYYLGSFRGMHITFSFSHPGKLQPGSLLIKHLGSPNSQAAANMESKHGEMFGLTYLGCVTESEGESSMTLVLYTCNETSPRPC